MEYKKIISKDTIVVKEFYVRQHLIVNLSHADGYISINGRLIDVCNNNCIVIPKFSLVSCSVTRTKEKTITLSILVVDDNSMIEALSLISNTRKYIYPTPYVINTPRVIVSNFDLLQRCVTNIEDEKDKHALLYQCLFFMLCAVNEAGVNVFEHYNFTHNTSKKQIIIRFITQEPQRQWTINDIAYVLGLSPANLRRYLKEEGIILRQLLLNIRMGLALNYLTFTRYSILKISHLTGFKSPAYFCYLFKQKHGMTASAFRGALSKHVSDK